MREAHWTDSLAKVLTFGPENPLSFVGVGNPVKRDDSVGLFMAQELRGRLGPAPAPGLRIATPSVHPELEISKLDLSTGRLVVLDAVDAEVQPGSVIMASLADSRFGFFATHNLPLRMIPSVVLNRSNVFVLGVQPGDLGVGEGLSGPVASAAEEVVGEVVAGVRGGPG